MRTVWVSFDTIGRDCLEAAASAGAEIVGVVTLPGPIDLNRSGQCSLGDISARLGRQGWVRAQPVRNGRLPSA